MENTKQQTQSPETGTQKTGTKAKTLQPLSTQPTAVGSAGLGISIGLFLTALCGLLWKLWSSKKGKAYLKELYRDVKDEIEKLERQFLSDKTDLLYNPAIPTADKQAHLEQLKNKYNENMNRLLAKQDDLKAKLRGKF